MSPKTLRTLIGLGSALLLLLFLYSVAEILLLLFLAVLGSLYLGAITDRLQYWTALPRRLGILGAIVFTALVLTGIAYLMVPPVIYQVHELWTTLPDQFQVWDDRLHNLALHSPVAARLLGPLREGESYLGNFVPEIGQYFRDAVPYLFGGVRLMVQIIGVATMAVYLALRPAFYREGLIELIPPLHRQLARMLLAQLSHSLRAWIVGQTIMMTSLGILTWIGLQLLNVPYALAFGVFTGAVAIVPVFGTIISITLPALFLLGTAGPLKILAVLSLGIIVHLIETNVVSPMIMEHQVDLPPVLTLLSVLIMAHLLGLIGLLVAVPLLASVMVIIRWLYINRVVQGKGFRRAIRDRPIEIRLPAKGVIIHPSARGVSLPSLLE